MTVSTEAGGGCEHPAGNPFQKQVVKTGKLL